MQRRPAKKVALRELAVSYGGSSMSGPLGSMYNPFGLSVWRNIENMVCVFVMKRFIVFGKPVIRAVRLRGLRDPRARLDLYPPRNQPPSLREFIGDCVRLLLIGKPLERINSPVRLRPSSQYEFRLVRTF